MRFQRWLQVIINLFTFFQLNYILNEMFCVCCRLSLHVTASRNLDYCRVPHHVTALCYCLGFRGRKCLPLARLVSGRQTQLGSGGQTQLDIPGPDVNERGVAMRRRQGEAASIHSAPHLSQPRVSKSVARWRCATEA